MENIKKICPVCGAALAASRLAQWPSAVVCGKSRCSKKYKRAAYNTIRRRYRHKRIAADPEFRLRETARARNRYALRRLAAGKTVVRKPIASERAAIDTFLAALGRAARAFRRRLMRQKRLA